MDISSFLQVNLLPLGIITYMFVVVVYSRSYEPEVTRYFFAPIALLLLLVVEDNWEYYLMDINSGDFIHKFVTILGYNLRLLLLFTVIAIIHRKKGWFTRLMLSLPALINFVITIFGLFTDIMFTYDADGNFHRGLFGFEPHFASLVYGIILILSGIECIVTERRMDGLVIIFGCLLNVTATLLETIFLLRGMILGTAALLIVFYYLCIHIEFMNMDILTGAWNRMTFSRDLKKYSTGLYAMVILDINDLKIINDTEGHDAGDRAIQIVSRTVLNNLPKGSRLYRIGGDEFAVLMRRRVKEKLGDICSDLQELIKDEGYKCAFGFAVFDGRSDFEEVMKIADLRMYENKKKIKGIA